MTEPLYDKDLAVGQTFGPDGLTTLRDDPRYWTPSSNESDGVLGGRAEPRRGVVQGPRMLEVLVVGGR